MLSYLSCHEVIILLSIQINWLKVVSYRTTDIQKLKTKARKKQQFLLRCYKILYEIQSETVKQMKNEQTIIQYKTFIGFKRILNEGDNTKSHSNIYFTKWNKLFNIWFTQAKYCNQKELYMTGATIGPGAAYLASDFLFPSFKHFLVRSLRNMINKTGIQRYFLIGLSEKARLHEKCVDKQLLVFILQ